MVHKQQIEFILPTFNRPNNLLSVDGYNIISSRDKFFLEKNNNFIPTDIDIIEYLPILSEYKNLKLTEKRFKD